ncbi:MAG: lactate dehydrogenase [Spirochaetales bacterium]|jgi:D-lactate dehydrogenase|nr:lactate dehydrogenase [Spirochaetales bacterium]
MKAPLKILAYSLRKDEAAFFEKFGKKHGMDLTVTEESPTAGSAGLAEGFPCVSIITTPVGEPVLRALYEGGVRFISTRTIGYDHIDLAAARALGMRFGNVSYSPDAVANYTVMLMLMCIRKVKEIERLACSQDFSLRGVRGFEMKNLTVGIAGTGRIGQRVIENLSGFGCRILAYDVVENEAARLFARYVSWEEMCRDCDIISLHIPAAGGSASLVGREALAAMKDGVFIINTSRGSLIDTPAFLEAVESGKIGGAALDVIEDEASLYYKDLRGEPLSNRSLAVLRSYPNVIVTPHTAFYTDQAVSDMVENSLLSCAAFIAGTDNPWEVKL